MLNPGDTIVCVRNDGVEHMLALGKTYKVIDIDEQGCVRVSYKNGSIFGFYSNRFKLAEDKLNLPDWF